MVGNLGPHIQVSDRLAYVEKARHMAKQYRSKLWRTFRLEAIRIAEHACEQCNRHEENDVILHVHHKFYVEGRYIWEYNHKDCLVLCARCHAEHHGKVRPFDGWSYVSEDELDHFGDEQCELCQQDLKYVHLVSHSHWGELRVGCYCADLLTSSTQASEREIERKRRISRRKNFISSTRWSTDGSITRISISGIGEISIRSKNGKFRICFSDSEGKQEFTTLPSAKAHLFDIWENGLLLDWTRKHRRKTGFSLRKPIAK